MGIQRQIFQLELERVKEKLEMVESRSLALEEEVRSPKSPKPTHEQELAQSAHATIRRQKPGSNKPVEGSKYHVSLSIPAMEKAPTIPSSSKVTNGVKATKPAPKSYAQIAASNVTKGTPDKPWTEFTSNNRKQKDTSARSPKTEPEKGRVIFRRKATFPQQSEANLMLVLNKLL